MDVAAVFCGDDSSHSVQNSAWLMVILLLTFARARFELKLLVHGECTAPVYFKLGPRRLAHCCHGRPSRNEDAADAHSLAPQQSPASGLILFLSYFINKLVIAGNSFPKESSNTTSAKSSS
jgi:hypothetical protein